jgi:uncharacterized membrane protein
MNDVSLEEILVLLVFVLYPLLQFIVERIRRGAAVPPAEDESAEPLAQGTGTTLMSEPAEAPAGERASAAQTPAVPSPRSRRHDARRGILGGRQALRRAIVLKTILGPCRADEPPG